MSEWHTVSDGRLSSARLVSQAHLWKSSERHGIASSAVALVGNATETPAREPALANDSAGSADFRLMAEWWSTKTSLEAGLA